MSRRIAFNINSPNTKSFSGLPNARASRNRRNRSLSVMQRNKPQKTEVTSLSHAKSSVTELTDLMKVIIDSSEATPDIQTALRPLLNGIVKGYPKFCALGTQFFAYVADRRSTKSRQAFSTAPLKPAMQEFTKYFDQFNTLVNNYDKNGPRPHAKEISLKFKSISIALDKVDNANLSRKYPSQSISSSIRNLQTLTDQIDVTVTDLYKNPSFSQFTSNIASMYVNDVQAIMNRLNSAFKFDFIQCGLTTHEYQRTRLSIMANCTIIIKALTASFEFVKQIKTAQIVIKKIKDEIQWVIDEVNSNFCVYKPTGIPALDAEPRNIKSKIVPESKKKESLLTQFVGKKEEEIKMDPNELKMRMFLKEVMPTIGETYVGSGEIWDMLAVIEKKSKFYDKRIKELEDENRKVKSDLREIKDTYFEHEEYYKSKIMVMTGQLQKNEEEVKKVSDKNKKITSKRESLITEIDKQQKVIDTMIIRGDPLFLRKSLCKIADRMGEMLGKKRETVKDTDLVKFAFSSLEEIDERYKNEISSLKKEMETQIKEKDAQLKVFQDEKENQLREEQEKEQQRAKAKGHYVGLNSKDGLDGRFRSTISLKGNPSRRRSPTTYKLYNDDIPLSIVEFTPIIDMLDAVTGKDFGKINVKDSKDLKELVAKEIEVISTAFSNLSEKLAEKTNYINSIEELLKKEGCLEETPEEQIRSLAGRLKCVAKPLKDAIHIKEKEISETKTDKSTLEERIKGIARSSRITIPENANSFQVLELIQDASITNYEKFTEAKEEAEKLRDCLKELETDLLRVTGRKNKFSRNDDDLIKAVFRYVDDICDQSYSQDYMQIEKIDSLFSSLKDEIKHSSPDQYIPAFIRKYKAYKEEMNSLIPVQTTISSVIKNIGQSRNSSTDLAYIKANISSTSALLSKLMSELEERTAIQIVSQCISLLSIVL